tara:strand:+ start:126 stop:314 length:189 start_codon:yes stop_codon:yes gene_type:complete
LDNKSSLHDIAKYLSNLLATLVVHYIHLMDILQTHQYDIYVAVYIKGEIVKGRKIKEGRKIK